VTSEQELELDRAGYVILPGFMSPDFRAAITGRIEELYAQEGENAGSEFRHEPGARRLANLAAKGEIFQRAFADPRILELIAHILGPRFKLASVNARSAAPDGQGMQPLHVDMGALPDAQGYTVANVVWMLDDFTPENGAMRAVPGSHKSGQRPPAESHPGEILVTGKAGTVCVMNAHLWHGGTTNHTSAPRRALHSFYCRWDLPQQQYQKRLIPSDVQAVFSPAIRGLLALDDPDNDEISSKYSNQSGFLR
jgi:ectoine hydroxylase-related dioxygenase (phytanoyl-CoA dioxygenase family)